MVYSASFFSKVSRRLLQSYIFRTKEFDCFLSLSILPLFVRLLFFLDANGIGPLVGIREELTPRMPDWHQFVYECDVLGVFILLGSGAV